MTTLKNKLSFKDYCAVTYFGAITLFKIAMMHICECSAKICLAELSSLYREFFEINFGARFSKSYFITCAIIDIAFDASFVIYDLKSVSCIVRHVINFAMNWGKLFNDLVVSLTIH